MEQQQKQPTPNNIFGAINQNIVDMSKDMVIIYNTVAQMSAKIDDIFAALYPPMPQEESEPNADGADTINE